MCVHVCLTVASASLAAGISQSTDRTCCLSGRLVAIVTLSASLRCFWETIPHPNQLVWVLATGASYLTVPVRHFSFYVLLFASSPLRLPFEHCQSLGAVTGDRVFCCVTFRTEIN